MSRPNGGWDGPVVLSRATGSGPEMPAAQGYFATGGEEFRPTPGVFVPGRVPPPPSGANLNGIGVPWAPGQGGDTPGGGGAGMIGERRAVDTSGWITNGFVQPLDFSHAPGSVGASSRRGKASQAWPGNKPR